MAVRRMRAEEWEVFRVLRLGALAEAPTAFGSSHAVEAALDEQQWRARARDRVDAERWVTVFGLDAAGVPVGLASGYRSPEDPVLVQLVSMWVAPAARGRGLGREIVEEILGWARASGCRAVGLQVTEGNVGAERLYASLGFRFTGHTEPHRAFPALRLRGMELELQAGGGGADLR